VARHRRQYTLDPRALPHALVAPKSGPFKDTGRLSGLTEGARRRASSLPNADGIAPRGGTATDAGALERLVSLSPS
jgi:hypothetical protein